MIPTQKRTIFITLSILAVVLLFENIILTVNKNRHDKAIIGLKLYGQRIDSMDRKGLADFVDQLFKGNKRNLALQFNNQVFELKRSDIDFSYDPSTVAKALLSIGHQGTFWQKLKVQSLAVFGLYDKKVKAVFSKDKLIPKIRQIGARIYKEPIPPQPDFKNDINQTIPAKTGLRIDANKFSQLIADNVLYPPSGPLPVPTEPVPANFNEADLVSLRKEGRPGRRRNTNKKRWPDLYVDHQGPVISFKSRVPT